MGLIPGLSREADAERYGITYRDPKGEQVALPSRISKALNAIFSDNATNSSNTTKLSVNRGIKGLRLAQLSKFTPKKK